MSRPTATEAEHCHFPSLNSQPVFTTPQWQPRKHPLVTAQAATRQKTTDCSSRCSYKIPKVHGAKTWWNRLRFTATGGSLREGTDMVTWPLVHTAERTGRPSTETSVVSSEARAQGRAQGCREKHTCAHLALSPNTQKCHSGGSKHSSCIFNPLPNKISDFRSALSMISKSCLSKCTALDFEHDMTSIGNSLPHPSGKQDAEFPTSSASHLPSCPFFTV